MDCGSLLPLFLSQPAGANRDNLTTTLAFAAGCEAEIGSRLPQSKNKGGGNNMTQSASPFVLHDGDTKVESFEWGTLRWVCNGKLSPGAEQTVGVCHIQPGCRNPVHFHPNCEEVLHMISGTGEHSYDSTVVRLVAGSTIRIPRGVRHNMVNVGTEPIVCLISFSSGDRQTVFLE